MNEAITLPLDCQGIIAGCHRKPTGMFIYTELYRYYS